jgi:hypothetical protein
LDLATLRTVRATRYVTPLREGGSLPAIVEADDLGMYVLKFRGAGQGPLALAAELIGGEVLRLLGLQVPELVFIEVDAALGRNEADPEIRELLQASVGLNLGMDYLHGSVMFDPAAQEPVAPEVASCAVWADSYVLNIDRTPQNPNLLCWHKQLYFIDHGAALYFHHQWENAERAAETIFSAIRTHVLLPWASKIADIDQLCRERITSAALEAIVEQLPAGWVAEGRGPAAYVDVLLLRLAAADGFVKEAQRAHAELV